MVKNIIIKAFLIILTIAFITLCICNHQIDKYNKNNLNTISKNDVFIPINELKIDDKKKVEHIIKEYLNNRNKNKSNITKIKSSFKDGLVKSAVTGFIVGNTPVTVIYKSVTVALLNGTLKAYNLYRVGNSIPNGKYLLKDNFV